MRNAAAMIRRLNCWHEYFCLRTYNPLSRNISKSVNNKLIGLEEPKKRLKSYHPKNSGDLKPIQFPADQEIHKLFKDNETLKNCDNPEVLRIFSMITQAPTTMFEHYKQELVDKVKEHKHDDSSLVVKIAELTANIRLYQFFVYEQNKKGRYYRLKLHTFVKTRKTLLKELRGTDYKQYEWLLQELDLTYKNPPPRRFPLTRKQSLELLADLSVLKNKEKKIAHYKEMLDNDKVPFLIKKIEKYKWIQEQEKKFNLNSTVSDADIENCVKLLDKVRVDIKERQKEGYMRKIHPFTLELYKPKKTIDEKTT